MASIKRIANLEDNVVDVEIPVSNQELASRNTDYPNFSNVIFAKKYRDALYKPVTLTFNGSDHKIQKNFCTDPYCKWFNKDQKRFDNIKNKPYRYKLGTNNDNTKFIRCNSDPEGNSDGITLNCYNTALSNWSIAEEIKRLSTNDTVKDMVDNKDYVFHREDCPKKDLTPFDNPKDFYKRGKSTGKSQKWQCKLCKKITNELPERANSSNYHQKRNDILPRFSDLLISRTPVSRACNILGVSPSTYYNKLEWLYKKCLEFNERHETQAFKKLDFESAWINTDSMIYYLNNVRMRGKGGDNYDEVEEQKFPTQLIVSSDVDTRYVFRSDVAYDWNVTINDIADDTIIYREDHLDAFARKNARLRYSYFPVPPVLNDKETYDEYADELVKVIKRTDYVDGLHVNSTYTTTAHLWLIKQLVNSKKWRFVTDHDSSLITSTYRAFADDFTKDEALHFICKTEKNKKIKDAYGEWANSQRELNEWADRNGFDKLPQVKKAFEMLKVELVTTPPWENCVDQNGIQHPKWANRGFKHPLPSKSEGTRWIDCTSNISDYDIDHITNLFLKVNMHSADSFMQQIRRSLSILERPLVTARGEGKSYIYANFNPRYAQYATTILRTYYNFCLKYKTKDKVYKTPAQRIGLTDKVFDFKDIIYFK